MGRDWKPDPFTDSGTHKDAIKKSHRNFRFTGLFFCHGIPPGQVTINA